MTGQQKKFVENLALGMRASRAAKEAGYTHPDQEAYRLRRNPEILEAAFIARQAKIQTELAPVAVEVLQKLIEDDTVSPKVRLQACIFTLQAAGHGQLKKAQDSAKKQLHEMSQGEIAEFIEQQKQLVAELKQVGPVVDCPEVSKKVS